MSSKLYLNVDFEGNDATFFIFHIFKYNFLGDPERLPKEVVLKRAADLAEALYSMPRGGLAGSRTDLSAGRTVDGYNYGLTSIQHDSGYEPGSVDEYNRQNSSPRYK